MESRPVWKEHRCEYLALAELSARSPMVGDFGPNTKTGEGLTPEGLYSIVREWGWKIGIKLCVHDLRRSMAVMGDVEWRIRTHPYGNGTLGKLEYDQALHQDAAP